MGGYLQGFLFLVVIFVTAKITCQQMQRRIMNGIETEIENLPWVVAFCREDLFVFGSGSILSEKWVLTAGHLWDVPYSEESVTYNKDNAIIKYGATVIDEVHGEVAGIDDIFVHPYYFDPDKDDHQPYDSAVVRVDGQLMLKPGFAAAKALADDSESYEPGEVCVLAGFGNTGDSVRDAQPHQLSFLPLPIIERSVCKRYFNPPAGDVICAGVLKIAASGCAGDSGAPFTCRGRIYAIHTRGQLCKPGAIKPGVFVLVKKISPFIREVMEYE